MGDRLVQGHTYYPLGHLDGSEVGVQPTLDGQDILIQDGDVGQHLASLLGFGNAEIVRQDETCYWRIVHNRQVDGLLVELIDLLISIRYSHPTLVQLQLELEPAEP